MSEIDNMITEEEAFWAGIAVAVMMLGGGFSMLFLQTFTGYGAVVLALGLMTMALTIQLRATPNEQIEAFNTAESRILEPTSPVESQREIVETQSSNRPEQDEEKTEQVPNEPQEEREHAEEGKPAENEPEPTKPVEPIEPATTEPRQPPQSPEPQAPVEEKTEPPKTEETPREEPPIVLVPS